MGIYLQKEPSFRVTHFFKKHKFHIITKNDSLPFFVSLTIANVLLCFVNYLNSNNSISSLSHYSFFLKLSLLIFIFILFEWFFTVNKEASYGFHTKRVQLNILKGMFLFILSEVMFFFSIF